MLKAYFTYVPLFIVFQYFNLGMDYINFDGVTTGVHAGLHPAIAFSVAVVAAVGALAAHTSWDILMNIFHTEDAESTDHSDDNVGQTPT